MLPQQRQHLIFRVDDRAQHGAALFKADEFKISGGLGAHPAHQPEGGSHILITQHGQHPRPLFKTAPGQTQQNQFLAALAGQKPGIHPFAHLPAQSGQPHRHPGGTGHVGGDVPAAKQRQLSLLRRQNRRREFLFGVAFKNAAQKTGKASVITVSDVCHMRRVRHVSASSRTSRAASGTGTPCSASW